MRVVLPTGDGGVVHLFVFHVYQGLEEDLGKLFAHGETAMCCTWNSSCSL